MDKRTIRYYNGNARQLALNYFDTDVTQLHSLLDRWVLPGSFVLDIGCGCGREALFLASRSCRVMAVDASEKMLEQASGLIESKELSPLVILKRVAFPTEPDEFHLTHRFDAILAIAVLMHIPEHEISVFLTQIRQLLKESGILICSVSSARESPYGDERLYVNRPLADIQHLLSQNGFRLIFCEDNADGMGRALTWWTLVCTTNDFS